MELSMQLGRLKLDPTEHELGPLYHVVLDNSICGIQIEFIPLKGGKSVNVNSAVLNPDKFYVTIYYLEKRNLGIAQESLNKLDLLGFSNIKIKNVEKSNSYVSANI